MGFGKHFVSMYEGSMFGAGLNVFAVWGYVIAHVQKQRVELNPKLLAATLGGDIEDIEAAIDYLTQPDPESRCKEHEGRRLVREGQFQYFVPTARIYRGMRDEDARREYNREKMAEARAKQKATPADDSVCQDAPPTSNGGTGNLMDDLEASVRQRELCPPAMLAELQESAMQVYGTDYPVSEFLDTFVYPADSVLTAEDIREAIRETGLAGVKNANWTLAKLRGWHATGGRPVGSAGGSQRARSRGEQVDEWIDEKLKDKANREATDDNG